MFDRARPFDLNEGRVDGDQMVAGNDPAQQDGDSLAVLAAAGVDGDESTGTDHLAAQVRHGNTGEVGGHGSVSPLAVRRPLSGPGIRLGNAARHLLSPRAPAVARGCRCSSQSDKMRADGVLTGGPACERINKEGTVRRPGPDAEKYVDVEYRRYNSLSELDSNGFWRLKRPTPFVGWPHFSRRNRDEHLLVMAKRQ